MIKIENENTFLKACAEGINLFAGSGFATLAQDSSKRFLPTGSQLFDELASRFNERAVDGLSLPQLCTIIESDRRDQLYSYLKDRFTVKVFDPRYAVLDSLALTAIFTTNIDDLFFKIYKESHNHYLHDISIRGPAFAERLAIDFIALHGSVTHPSEKLVFGSSDLAASFSSDPDKWHLLTGKLQQRPTLFWGYSLSDAGTLQALNPITTRSRPHSDKWVALRNPSEGEVKFFSAMGFQVIESDTITLLDYLKANVQPQQQHVKARQRASAHVFPEYALPPPGTIPVRPILDFFLGNTPTWHDIYDGRIPRTHHFGVVQNLINASTDGVVIGMPACGKTTLMMQLASSSQTDAHKLVCSLLTENHASLIIRKLDNERALVFMDDFTDSIEAFNVLATAPNVTVLGFDRDLNYEVVSHKVKKRNIPVVDVSELSARDIQDVFSVIPTKIRKDHYISPEMGAGVDPSIYEVIESNITEPRLNERFGDVLRDLESSDEPVHDLLVMCCYVHSCRTPVSFDMALAFMRPVTEHYEEVYKYFERLRNLIVGDVGELTDADQDYYSPRSRLVADAILKQVSPSSFKRVLLRFHEEVSSYRICHFDIFRRRAFDATFVGAAFRSWQEGMQFYERRYQSDRSPYLKQQGALYLAHMRRYTEAFRWIDEAVSESHYRIPSIRHTHAIILFRANVNASEVNGTKRNMLDRSMHILEQCYEDDRRKTYHAMTFADQALQYFALYADQIGYEYLETSAKWLREEKRFKPWHRNVDRLLRQVERILQR